MRKGWARAVWDGPFHVGPLSSPASAGDAILKVCETLWRAVVVAVCIVFVAIALWLGVEVLDPGPLRQRVEAKVAYDPLRCGDGQPIGVLFVNHSREQIGRVTFKIEARRPGRSTNLVLMADPYRWMDTVLSPGGQTELCYGPPMMEAGAVPAALDFSADVVSVDGYDGPVPTPPAIVQKPR